VWHGLSAGFRAEAATDLLMGSQVGPPREFIAAGVVDLGPERIDVSERWSSAGSAAYQWREARRCR